MNTAVTVAESTPEAAANNIVAVIERAATNPDVDIEKMERLLAMQERIMDREAEMAFNDALNQCQRDIPTVFKAAQNADNKSRYAKLEAVDEAIRPFYVKHGFSLSFGSRSAEGGVTVTCKVSHRGGHSREYELTGALDSTGMKGGATKTAIQGLGSSVSYLRRYLTCMIFNVILTDEDNDGQAVEQFLSPTQVKILVEKLGGPGERVAAFCKSLSIVGFHEVAASEFDKLVARINRFNAAA